MSVFLYLWTHLHGNTRILGFRVQSLGSGLGFSSIDTPQWTNEDSHNPSNTRAPVSVCWNGVRRGRVGWGMQSAPDTHTLSSLSLSLARALSLSLSLTHSISLSHTHSLSLSHTNTLKHIYTHAHTHLFEGIYVAAM
jgi:hypothetical protein